MTRDEEIINAIDKIIPIPPSGNGRTYEQALMATGFEMGVKWADTNTKSPWISVEKDLPCNHEELMHSFFTDKTTDVIVAIHGDFRLSRMIKWCDKWIWESYIPTYWMPIPKLPKIS